MTAEKTVAVDNAPEVSVVMATYNRADSAVRLLRLLDEQTVAADRVEVIVVDDESRVPVAEAVSRARLAREPLVIRQKNGGPAVARDAGIRRARGKFIVVIDDDMLITADFVSAHLAAHADGRRRLVLGRLHSPPGVRLPLFERLHLALLDQLFDEVATGTRRPNGVDVYTGNVSFRRDDYVAVGGFDHGLRLSEDAELGMRLERDGVEIGLSDEAFSWHVSDHSKLSGWLRRGVAYGKAEAAIARKHEATQAIPVWRYLLLVNLVSRPFLLGSALMPAVFVPMARLVMLLAMLFGQLRLERVALAGATLAYGILYFAGVGLDAGSWRVSGREFGRFMATTDSTTLGGAGRLVQKVARIALGVLSNEVAIRSE